MRFQVHFSKCKMEWDPLSCFWISDLQTYKEFATEYSLIGKPGSCLSEFWVRGKVLPGWLFMAIFVIVLKGRGRTLLKAHLCSHFNCCRRHLLLCVPPPPGVSSFIISKSGCRSQLLLLKWVPSPRGSSRSVLSQCLSIWGSAWPSAKEEGQDLRFFSLFLLILHTNPIGRKHLLPLPPWEGQRPSSAVLLSHSSLRTQTVLVKLLLSGRNQSFPPSLHGSHKWKCFVIFNAHVPFSLQSQCNL